MSIMQEYEWLRQTLEKGEFEAIEKYLSLNPNLLLSDIYYNKDEYQKFRRWWESNKDAKWKKNKL